MKKFIKLASLGVALLGITLTGCKKETQSSRTVDDIQTTIKIVGKVSFSTGQDWQNGRFVELTGNPVGKTVFVSVPYLALGGGTGNKIFSDTVRPDGTYEIEIPLLSQSNQITVFVEPFMGTFREFDSLNGNTPVFKTTKALFSMAPVNPASGNAVPNNAYVRNLNFTPAPVEAVAGAEFNSTITLSGRIGQAASRDVATHYYLLTSGLNVLIDVQYLNQSGGVITGLTRTFATTTTAQGRYTVTIPALEDNYQISVTLRGIPFRAPFTHRLSGDPSSMVLQGVYRVTTPINMGAITPVPGITYLSEPTSRLRYDFFPDPSPINDIPGHSPFNSSNWGFSTPFDLQ
jgi:hypothetical protein